MLWQDDAVIGSHFIQVNLMFLNPQNECLYANTQRSLDYHATVLDLMGMGKDSVMVIHGGGVYGDKPATIKRWIQRYHELPEKESSRDLS